MAHPLRSARVTRHHRYYETVRPRVRPRYSGPCGFCHLDLSLSQPNKLDQIARTTGSHVPHKSPDHARATSTPDTTWAVSRHLPDQSRSKPTPVSMSSNSLTTRHQWFALARLRDPYLTHSSARRFRNAHHPDSFTDAACGGLKPPPARRLRRAYLHLSYSTAPAATPYIRTPPSRSWHTGLEEFLRVLRQPRLKLGHPLNQPRVVQPQLLHQRKQLRIRRNIGLGHPTIIPA